MLLADGPLEPLLSSPSPRAVLTSPDEVARGHAAWAEAGAQVLRTHTLGLSPASSEDELERLEAICGWSERLCRSAGPRVTVAGALRVSGERVFDARVLQALAVAGVDLFWLEGEGAPLRQALAVASSFGRRVIATGEVEGSELLVAAGASVVTLPDAEAAPERWAERAESSGATVLAGGENTTPAHLAALVRRMKRTGGR